MGSNLAYDLASDELGLSLENSLAIHLRSNHYPPAPLSMVQVCIDAIDAYHDEDYDSQIELPEGISWRGSHTAPASAIVDAHHLDAWLPHTWDCLCDDCMIAEEQY